MKDPLHHFPGYSLRRAATAMTAELSVRLARFDVRQVDATVMILIDATPLITASQLGRMLDIQRANMVPLLKRLEDAELVVRVPIDGKSQGLTLTETGKQRLAEVLEVIATFEHDLLARIPGPHREHLLPALDALWR
jgi:DNA-binding MarR family transcriptional regulator